MRVASKCTLGKETGPLMQKELEKEVWLFLDDDAGFIGWCEKNPDGFFFNCFRNKAGDVVRPYMLHTAMGGTMCPHFRNSNREAGVEPNLTTASYCKVCSIDQQALEKWAKNLRNGLRHCSSCIGRR
jgi:hypothetical protein